MDSAYTLEGNENLGSGFPQSQCEIDDQGKSNPNQRNAKQRPRKSPAKKEERHEHELDTEPVVLDTDLKSNFKLYYPRYNYPNVLKRIRHLFIAPNPRSHDINCAYNLLTKSDNYHIRKRSQLTKNSVFFNGVDLKSSLNQN